MQDITGKPVMLKDYTNVTGFPYLNDNWTKGSVTTMKGKVYNNLFLKYDLVEDVVYFKSDKDESLLFIDPIKSFELDLDNNIESFTNGFLSVDNYTYLSYYQVIFKGDKMTLLIKDKKYISETKPYNSATTERKFIENNTYYIFRNGKMEKFKPSKKDILALFNDKSEQVSSFIKTSNIDFKNNIDLVKVFDFYYSLN